MKFSPRYPTPPLGATALGGLIAGLVTGATYTAAKNVRKVKKGEITKKQAAAEIVREAGTMGFAASLGVTTTALLGLNGVLSVASLALFTTAGKCAIDSLLESKEEKNKAIEMPQAKISE